MHPGDLRKPIADILRRAMEEPILPCRAGENPNRSFPTAFQWNDIKTVRSITTQAMWPGSHWDMTVVFLELVRGDWLLVVYKVSTLSFGQNFVLNPRVAGTLEELLWFGLNARERQALWEKALDPGMESLEELLAPFIVSDWLEKS